MIPYKAFKSPIYNYAGFNFCDSDVACPSCKAELDIDIIDWEWWPSEEEPVDVQCSECDNIFKVYYELRPKWTVYE